jgi:hypothetical protein
MSVPDEGANPAVNGESDRLRTVLQTLRLLRCVVRIPVVAFLELLEPLLRSVLVAVALVSILTAAFFKFAAPSALHFPFWGMLAAASASLALLALYTLALRFLSA